MLPRTAGRQRPPCLVGLYDELFREGGHEPGSQLKCRLEARFPVPEAMENTDLKL